MKNKLLTLIVILLTVASGFGAERQKLAQTGMVFLSLSLDARMSALGRATVALEGGSTSMLYNPAGMARLPSMVSTTIGQLNWIADFQYQFATLSYSPSGGQYGVFGLTYIAPDYGSFQGSIKSENEQGFLDTGEFSPIAYSIGLSYARALTDRFSIGGHMKYVYQNLTGGAVNFKNADQQVVTGEFDANVLAFDFGILYKTGYQSLTFGMYVRNFSQQVQYYEEAFELPLTFEIGVAMDMLDLTDLDSDRHDLLLAIDASHPRDYYEQIDVGLEYTFLKQVSLRAGLTSPTDEEGMSFGAGLRQEVTGFDLNVDYAYTPFGVFGDVHRFAFGFSF